MAALGIILINYNGAADTCECLASLAVSTYRNHEVIVVDNGSTDGLADKLGDQQPPIVLLRSEVNLGFAGGNNLGIAEALRRGCQSILLLNNDTIVPPNALAELMRAQDQFRDSILVPKIVYADPPGMVWFAGGRFSRLSFRATHRGIGETDDRRWDVPAESDFATGCALLASRAIFERVGLLDESFFAYSEDVDFCLRARTIGVRVRYAPAAVIRHKVSRTSSWDSPLYHYLNLRNRILLVRKHARWYELMTATMALAGFIGRQVLRLGVKYRDSAGVRALLLGLLDGLSSPAGEAPQARLQEICRLPRKTRLPS